MSMQKHRTISVCHRRSVSALGYHLARRELLTGFEDGAIKWWDLETGYSTFCVSEHTGMITQLLYWAEHKLLFSSSNDGTIVVWTIGATVFDRIMLNASVFCMAINHRRHQLICGFKNQLRVFPLDEKKDSGHVLDLGKSFTNCKHKDIVSAVVCLDTRIYSAGYDKKLIIYNTSSYPNSRTLQVIHCNSTAHDAGITNLMVVREMESTRLMTGSFDKSVKVWSQDGQLILKLPYFSGFISSLCFVPCVNTVWICSGVSSPSIFDPSSGEIVSESIETFQNQENRQPLHQLVCIPETNHIIGASREHKDLTVWKYNKMGSITVLRSKQPVECLSYTKKEPILLFSGHSDGTIIKWERQQSSYFLYSHELFNMFETQSMEKNSHSSSKVARISSHHKVLSAPRPVGASLSRVEGSSGVKELCKPTIPPSFTRSVYVEELDMLVLAADNGNIYLWGFDDSLCSILKMMPSKRTQEQNNTKTLEHFSKQSVERQCSPLEEESVLVTNRVSGFVCKKVLSHHVQPVGGIAVVGRDQGYNTDYLISGGWDRHLCVWDLQTGVLYNTFSNTAPGEGGNVQELACDGAILDLAYSPKRNEFAYSSSDGMVYIRHFSPITSEMKLVSVLQGHEADITSILWHSLFNKWLSGSEDGTIRIWSEDGTQCEQLLATHRAVNCLCIDQVNGCIIAGIQERMSVYDPETFIEVQRNIGHTDSICSIIHIPERTQYITASWDRTLRVWNAYIKLPPKTKEIMENAKSATI
ncbi:uncharacterized protein LOC132405308 isoform X3 [Hypanus sabinus]|uniref:uncharacterized protein LOC132405308 isoform X3 n=1 Tax=Hypanus sabinus TaxID=79690 RepID=UPI0028C4F8E2|nr:uncharacterized protein LOC132405308 isoform X3 [Hypanus sabinus]